MNFGFAEVGLPLLVLTLLAVALPVVTVPRGVMCQGRLALGMALVAMLVFVGAAGWFAVSHWRAGDAFRWGAVLGPATMSAFAWGPVWALVWLVRAQGVERRRGEAAARAGLDLGRED
ncbi:MAG: hypothetical protein KDK53_04595 [Maritimibacter sp.]|nr:hypothetical protein [Maritimibacter sp.]